jgi:chromosome segregation and condensation protein ScpB
MRLDKLGQNDSKKLALKVFSVVMGQQPTPSQKKHLENMIGETDAPKLSQAEIRALVIAAIKQQGWLS